MLIDQMPDKIVRYPDPRLRAKSLPIETFDESLVELAQVMLRIMRDNDGVGLAAPQVGINLRMFVANPTGEPKDGMAFVNPELNDLTGGVTADEGCLSLPDVRVEVRRASRCDITAQDVHGNRIQGVCEDLMARIVQHEIDHLDGTLLLDKMNGPDRIANRKAIKEMEQDFQR